MTERERFEAWLDECDAIRWPTLSRRQRFSARVVEDFRTGWLAALAAQSAIDGFGGNLDSAFDAEPVAWLVQYDDETRSGSFVTMSLDDAELYCAEDKEIVPLYLAPTIPEGWISVEDWLPNPGEENIICWCGWPITGVYRPKDPMRGDHDWYSEPVGMNPIFHVTHWMPLPSPPAAVKELK